MRTKSVLYIHELETGKEYPIYENLSKDQSEAWAVFGVYPHFAWMPNNKDIVLWSQGKINRINIDTKQITNIPFQVDQEIKLTKKHVRDFSFQAEILQHFICIMLNDQQREVMDDFKDK